MIVRICPDRSPSYRKTVASLVETGILSGHQAVELFPAHGGFLDVPAVLRSLENPGAPVNRGNAP